MRKLEEKDVKAPNALAWWIFAIIICLGVCVGGFLLTLYFSQQSVLFPTKGDDCPPALFGDSFGAVNALISGLAFAGMIVTFVLQRYELSMQRKELEAQRQEFSDQNETMRLQRFENTFFHMMELQQSIVNDLYAKTNDKKRVKETSPKIDGWGTKEIIVPEEYRGRNLFLYAFLLCKHQVGTNEKVDGLRGVLEKKGIYAFDDYYTTTVFDHYFRHLYTILKFIDQNDWLEAEGQYKYATFVRATLSRYELVMLYYNGFFHPKMKKMMEKYCMLNNLRPELLVLSNENLQHLLTAGIKPEDLRSHNFSGTDFEFFLTDQENNPSKYHLSVFYTQKEIQEGKVLLEEWKEYVKIKSAERDSENG